MSRLLPCPSCGRHVRVVERECPFCASVLATVAAPSRLTVALLGLCLAACSTSKEPASKGDDKSPKEQQPSDVTPTPEPEPKPEPAEPEPEPAQPEPEPAQPDPSATTGAAPEENANVGTTDGSTTADPPKPPPEPKQKYGGPRPQKKYGAPPPPDEPL